MVVLSKYKWPWFVLHLLGDIQVAEEEEEGEEIEEEEALVEEEVVAEVAEETEEMENNQIFKAGQVIGGKMIETNSDPYQWLFNKHLM